MTYKPDTLSRDLDKDDFTAPSVVSAEAPEIIVEIPKPAKRNRDLLRLKRDTFPFEKDFRIVFRGIVAIVIIAAAIVFLVYYLLHQ